MNKRKNQKASEVIEDSDSSEMSQPQIKNRKGVIDDSMSDEELDHKINIGLDMEQSHIMSEPKRKEKGKVPEPLSKDHINMSTSSISINKVLTVEEYVDDQKAIKDKMWNLINKGLGETKTQTAA